MFFVVIKLIFLFPYLVVKFIKDNKQRGAHMYGIHGYFGLAGKGKTMAMVKELADLREKWGDQIYIMTNFFYNDQDFELTSWKDLLKPYDKPIVVAYDELPNEWNSREYKSFPTSLVMILTQLRKGNGMRILYTAQRWHMVDKNFRSLSSYCYECNTVLGAYTITRKYDSLDYDNLCSNSDYEKRRRIHPVETKSFVQTEELRNSYDSYKMLESAKSKEYMDRSELAQVYQMGE